MADSSNSKNAILFYGGFTFRAGGAFMHTVTLSEGLRARGWSVTTVTLDQLPPLLRYLPHIVAKLVNLVAAPLGFYYKGIVTRTLYRYFIKRDPGDLLVFEDIYLAWNSKNPSITLLHAVWSDNLQGFNRKEKGVDRLKTKEVALINRLSHPVVTVSKRYRNFLERNHFGNFGRVSLEVVELGLDTGRRRKHDFAPPPETKRSLIYCGALEARKNVHFMLEVFRSIAQTDPAASLTIVGNGVDREGLQRYAVEHDLNVTFLGRLEHPHVLDELEKHNIYIHTALKESFSFALLEAKLAGLTTCALAELEVPEEFIDIGFEGLDATEWSARILAIRGRPDLSDFPDYSIGRMTDHTLALVSAA